MSGVFTFIGIVLVVFYAFLSFRREYPVHNSGIVLVTGSTQGIGRHTVEYLAANYDYLILAGVRNESDFESIKNVNYTNLRPIVLELTNSSSIRGCVDEIRLTMDKTGLQFVGLINNAGIARNIIAEFHPLEDVRSIFEVNYFGALDLIQQTLPLLRISNGRIINLSSLSGFIASPGYSAYSASKHAIESLSDALRRELFNWSVSVSVIEPGFIKTNMSLSSMVAERSILSDQRKQEMLQTYNSFLTPEKTHKVLADINESDDPSVVTAAIEHALLSRFPKTRYQVAKYFGKSVWFLKWLIWILPDSIEDIIVLRT